MPPPPVPVKTKSGKNSARKAGFVKTTVYDQCICCFRLVVCGTHVFSSKMFPSKMQAADEPSDPEFAHVSDAHPQVSQMHSLAVDLVKT